METLPEHIEIKKIPVEEVMEALEVDGINLSREEAESLMDFLYELTRLVLKNHLM